MLIRYFQKGFNYSQDGHGNRLIYHLQGCNMKCPWCANPEGMSIDGVLMTEPEWLNENCCPKGAVREIGLAGASGTIKAAETAGTIKAAETAGTIKAAGAAGTIKTAGEARKENAGSADLKLDRSICESCSDKPCVSSMRQKGLHWSCREKEVSEIVSECVESKPMFFDGGGVTLTGGEMSLQFEAVSELLQRLGEEGIHRTVETNGSHPKARELASLVDEWIMDLKHTDSAKHKEWLGIGNERIKETLAWVTENHSDVLIRIPMMPGFNDSQEDAQAFADYLAPHAGGKNRDHVRVEVLTYHEFGKGKWAQCGMEYRMKSGKISPQQRACLEEQLKKAGMQVVRT